MELINDLMSVPEGPRFHAWLVLVVGLSFAILVSIFSRTVLLRITKRTKTDLDDVIVTHARGPLALTIGLASLLEALKLLGLPEYYVTAIISSIIVISWTLALNRIVGAMLKLLLRHQGQAGLVNARTMPIFEMMASLVVWGSSAYFLMVSWHFDPTAWLASAGIAGVALGFAAKDTLANLFAGVFIIADAPYKIGDYLVLDSLDEGRVTKIGFRATRLITRDDVEIIVPNSIMANARVTNLSGGPYEKVRIKVPIGVSYGSDIDLVRSLLLALVDVKGVAQKPEPYVIFEGFGDSSLNFVLLVWVTEPQQIMSVRDELNVRIYKSFNEHDVRIPFPQRDVHMIPPPKSP